jgi:hypothetical protein
MVGVIRGWDVLAHPVVTIRCFGWRVFFRAVTPWQGKTFLSLVQPVAAQRAVPVNVPGILDRCIGLELRAKRIYTVLGKALSDQGPVGPFFAGLAEQEQHHADLLDLCRASAIRGRWKAGVFNPWEAYLPKLEQQMDACEEALREIDSVDTALQMVLQIESSEINAVFNAAIAATDSPFAKRLRPFRKTMEAHMKYLAERLPLLSPNLMMACRELRARFPYART